MKDTLNKMFERSAETLKKHNLQDTYKDRDKEAEMLVSAFFANVGLGPDEEYTDFEDLDVGEFDAAKKAAKQTLGWSHYLDEEMEYLWFDGIMKGKMMICCRGGSYGAELTVFGTNGGKWTANNNTAGVWQPTGKRD